MRSFKYVENMVFLFTELPFATYNYRSYIFAIFLVNSLEGLPKVSPRFVVRFSGFQGFILGPDMYSPIRSSICGVFESAGFVD